MTEAVFYIAARHWTYKLPVTVILFLALLSLFIFSIIYAEAHLLLIHIEILFISGSIFMLLGYWQLLLVSFIASDILLQRF